MNTSRHADNNGWYLVIYQVKQLFDDNIVIPHPQGMS